MSRSPGRFYLRFSHAQKRNRRCYQHPFISRRVLNVTQAVGCPCLLIFQNLVWPKTMHTFTAIVRFAKVANANLTANEGLPHTVGATSMGYGSIHFDEFHQGIKANRHRREEISMLYRHADLDFIRLCFDATIRPATHPLPPTRSGSQHCWCR